MIKMLSLIGVLFSLFVVTGVYLWKDTYHADTALDALSSGQYIRASHLLAVSAESGNSNAQLLLGNLYYVGLGVDNDYMKAAHWYERAGMQGNADAQYNMALLYHQGLGLEKDLVAAAAWFLLADAGGNPASELFLRTLSGSMNPNKIQEAHRLQEAMGREISSGG